ncbi:SUKH-4 family immunity protein [Streptomyces sp. NPDC006551]|uniref:SUKH-4 family immunity protein n=1 Tax=Streptomyces sp. NPDC006551 TaxID=3157178 RepID=UPI0033B34C7E
MPPVRQRAADRGQSRGWSALGWIVRPGTARVAGGPDLSQQALTAAAKVRRLPEGHLDEDRPRGHGLVPRDRDRTLRQAGLHRLQLRRRPVHRPQDRQRDHPRRRQRRLLLRANPRIPPCSSTARRGTSPPCTPCQPSLKAAFDADGATLPKDASHWEVLGEFQYATVALDPRTGNVYSFAEGEEFYVPMHQDVSSLVHTLTASKPDSPNSRNSPTTTPRQAKKPSTVSATPSSRSTAHPSPARTASGASSSRRSASAYGADLPAATTVPGVQQPSPAARRAEALGHLQLDCS